VKIRPLVLFVTAALFLTLILPLGAAPSAGAQSGSRLFPETGKTVRGAFLQYWQRNGALAQQGFPISDEMQERSATDGKVYTVQYFERARMELHPELVGTPHEVLLGLLGAWQYRALYGTAGAPDQQANNEAGSVLFRETGKRVGGRFLRYWQQNGGLAQQGYPISDEIRQVSAIDGKPYTVQYFERAVFEHHPEMAGTPHEVMLSQLGRYRYNSRYGTPQLPAPKGSRAQLDLVASELVMAWREVELDLSDRPPDTEPTFVIRAIDLRSGRVIDVATTKNEFSKPAVSGSLVAYASENTACPACDLDIYVLDIATGQTLLVASGPAVQSAPVAHGRSVAWLEQEGGAKRVMLRDNVSAGAAEGRSVVQVVSDRPALSQELALSEKYLAWAFTSQVDRAAEITVGLMNRASGGITNPASEVTSILPATVALDGDMLLLREQHLTLVNLTTGARQRIYVEGTLLSAGASGGTAYWTLQKGDLVELWAAPLATTPPQPVLIDSGAIRNPAAIGNRVFYVKDGKLTNRPLPLVIAP
jgi:hypothetical protein